MLIAKIPLSLEQDSCRNNGRANNSCQRDREKAKPRASECSGLLLEMIGMTPRRTRQMKAKDIPISVFGFRMEEVF